MTTTDTAPAPDTPTEEAPAPATVTMRATVLRRVLDGLLPFASRDDVVPVLRSIRLRTREDEQLTAVATDRYRAGMVRLDGNDVWGLTGTIDAVLPANAVEALLAWLPEPNDDADIHGEATITQTGTRIEVKLIQLNYPAITFDTIASSSYPPVEGVIRAHLDHPAGLSQPIGLDGRLVSGLQAFQWKPGDVVRIWASDPHGAVAVAVGGHFVGVVMTVRHGDDRCYKDGPHFPWTTYDPAAWDPILGEPAARLGAEQEGADR